MFVIMQIIEKEKVRLCVDGGPYFNFIKTGHDSARMCGEKLANETT